MEYLVEGMSDKQIASELGISVRGAAFHRAHILEKMQAGSLVELAQEVSKLQVYTLQGSRFPRAKP
jgi:FixJ family two-component response regulator